MASSGWPVACLLLAGAAFFPGCFLDSGAFEAAGAGATPATTGGSGGATTATGGAGGAGGAGATGGTATGGAATGGTATGGTATGGTGGGTTTPCAEDVDCPVPASACLAPKCDKMKGTCTTKNANEGQACPDPPGLPDECNMAECKMGACVLVQLPKDTVVDDTKNGDCKKYVCDAAGNVISKPDDGDEPEPTDCATTTCSGGNQVLDVTEDGTACDPGIGNGTCCKGGCCNTFGNTCLDTGCCSDLLKCGSLCCDLGETCCGGDECCVVCIAGSCVF